MRGIGEMPLSFWQQKIIFEKARLNRFVGANLAIFDMLNKL